MTCTFTVMGVAQPKGSTSAFKTKSGINVTSANPKLKDWEHAVRFMTQREIQKGRWAFVPAGQAVFVRGVFYLPRTLKLKDRTAPHLTTPDLDKLARGLVDGLNTIAFADDKQVNALVVAKHYARVAEAPHVVITLTNIAL